jgi:hypothetical protein
MMKEPNPNPRFARVRGRTPGNPRSRNPKGWGEDLPLWSSTSHHRTPCGKKYSNHRRGGHAVARSSPRAREHQNTKGGGPTWWAHLAAVRETEHLLADGAPGQGPRGPRALKRGRSTAARSPTRGNAHAGEGSRGGATTSPPAAATHFGSLMDEAKEIGEGKIKEGKNFGRWPRSSTGGAAPRCHRRDIGHRSWPPPQPRRYG